MQFPHSPCWSIDSLVVRKEKAKSDSNESNESRKVERASRAKSCTWHRTGRVSSAIPGLQPFRNGTPGDLSIRLRPSSDISSFGEAVGVARGCEDFFLTDACLSSAKGEIGIKLSRPSRPTFTHVIFPLDPEDGFRGKRFKRCALNGCCASLVGSIVRQHLTLRWSDCSFPRMRPNSHVST
jgi:hypothetical protein